jgi:hypothetical protein
MGSKRGIFLSFLGKLPFLGSQGQIAKLRQFHRAPKKFRKFGGLQ